MTKFTDGAARVKQQIGSALRAPLIVTIAVIVILGALYYAFYRSQVAYYTGRNLRLIATLTAQINERVSMNSRFFRDGTLKPEKAKPNDPPVAQPDPIKRGTTEGNRGWEVSLRSENGSTAKVPLEDVLRPIFGRRVGAAFDMVLIVDAAGNILYSVRTPPAASSLMTTEGEPLDDEQKGLTTRNATMVRTANHAMRERESGSAMVVNDLTALLKRKSWSEYEPLKPDALLAGTEQLRVRLGDAEYVLFAQPYTFARPPVSLDGNQQRWIICGLVSAPRFRYDVSAISASMVLFAMAIALVALCCWPYLRIALIHPAEELTITDVALIVICTAVGAAVLTLAVLDTFAYRTLADAADEQLHDFTDTVVTDFASNVERAMGVLEHAEAVLEPAMAAEVAQPQPQPLPTDEAGKKTAAAAAPKPVLQSEKLPADFLKSPAVSAYPYIDAISWMDKDGKQVARYATRNLTPLSEVGQRQYFRDAMFDRSWVVKSESRKITRYVLEWVRSRATGEVRAVLAKRTKDDDRPVIALSTDLIDITYALRPPGVEMAIIDENGEVVYHSDLERIGFENFFTETDRNRELRSAVLARRESHVSASYWGEEKSMFVRPLTGSRWTLVAFRAKRLTRVLNVESALLTLVLMALVAAPYIFLYIFTLVVIPGYRAPSIWPDETRRGDYVRLCVIYVALLILFGLTTFLLMPWSSFYAVMLIPAVAVLSTYLVLHRVATPRRFAIAAALWIAVNAALFCVLFRNEVNPAFAAHTLITKTVLVAVAVAVASLTALLISPRGRPIARFFGTRVRLGYAPLYRLCGVLILLLCVVLPVAAFFNIARHVQSELLMKFGQLRAAADLENRIDQLETLNVRNDTTRFGYHDVLRPDILDKMFQSTWELKPPAEKPPRSWAEGVECAEPEPSDWTIPPGTASLLPALYEDSLAIRPLFDIGAADRLWHWCRQEGFLTLVRKVRFDGDVSRKLWGKTPDAQRIVISSPRTPRNRGESEWEDVLVPMLLCAFGLLILFWYAAGFIASRVLLMDVLEPHWMARLPLSPTLGDHIFLVRRDKTVAALTGPNSPGRGLPFLDISFAELARAKSWDAALEKLDSSAAGQNVRILDFEYGIHDGAIHREKLLWLERLLSLPDRTVIIVSSVTAAFVMTANASADDLARWRALLDHFVTVTAEELEMRHQDWKRRQDFRTRSELASGAPRNWLERETAYNPFLRRLRDELDPDADRAHLLDEISERAETYYAGLWASCRQDEKVLLYQLAHNGLANGRNRRTLRRLIARGLVRRDPNVVLFGETFRLFVLAAAQREDLVTRARAEAGASTWDSLRVPFFVVIISFLLLLFVTQKDLLTTTTALATALTTGLPIIMKLTGLFTEKRGEPARA